MFHLLLIVTLSLWLVPVMISCGKASKTKTQQKEPTSQGLKQQKAEEKNDQLEAEIQRDEEMQKADEKQAMEALEMKEVEQKRKEEEDRENAEEKLKEIKELNEYLSTKEKFAEKYSRWGRYLKDELLLTKCGYYENFTWCDIVVRTKHVYYSKRNDALRFATVRTTAEVRRWLLAEIRMAEVYLPLMETLVKENFDQLHKDHCVPETHDKLMKVYEAILAHHELIEKAWKTYEKQEPGVDKDVSELLKEPEKWMNREIFGEKERMYLFRSNSFNRDVLDTCRKQFGGECDFRERINHYVFHERMSAQVRALHDYLPNYVEAKKVCQWMDEEVKCANDYLPLIKEKIPMHKEHSKDKKRVEECYDQLVMTVENMKKYRKEIEKRRPWEDVYVQSKTKQRFPVPPSYWSFERREYFRYGEKGDSSHE